MAHRAKVFYVDFDSNNIKEYICYGTSPESCIDMHMYVCAPHEKTSECMHIPLLLIEVSTRVCVFGCVCKSERLGVSYLSEWLYMNTILLSIYTTNPFAHSSTPPLLLHLFS